MTRPLLPLDFNFKSASNALKTADLCGIRLYRRNCHGNTEHSLVERFYLTGFPIFHSLERARTTIIFNGYPSLCKTCRFYKLPCDREIDEALLAISIVLMIRAGLFLLSSIQDMLNVRFVIHHEQHPRMNPFQIKRKKKLDRLFVVSSVALWLLVIWLSYTVFESQTCASDPGRSAGTDAVE